MKTSIKKLTNPNIMKSLFALALTVLMFSSCSEESVSSSDDASLIAEIESASRISVSAVDLPAATTSSFRGELADTFVNEVQLAANLGYKVTVGTDDVSRMESTSDIFFSIQGRQLNDTDERRARRRNRCFEFVFPIDFIMPDDTSITLESRADWVLIKQWYDENDDVDERPTLVFPVSITLKEDGSVQTLIDVDELNELKQNCRMDRDKRKCFQLVLPVTFTMPDASEIIVNTRADFKLVRQWHKDNPDATTRASLNFPVEIIYRDGTTATVNDATEYEAAKDNCN